MTLLEQLREKWKVEKVQNYLGGSDVRIHWEELLHYRLLYHIGKVSVNFDFHLYESILDEISPMGYLKLSNCIYWVRKEDVYIYDILEGEIK